MRQNLVIVVFGILAFVPRGAARAAEAPLAGAAPRAAASAPRQDRPGVVLFQGVRAAVTPSAVSATSAAAPAKPVGRADHVGQPLDDTPSMVGHGEGVVPGEPGLADVDGATESWWVVAEPRIAFPYRVAGKYRYLVYRGAYYQRSYDYRRLFNYPWHESVAPAGHRAAGLFLAEP